MSGKRQKIQYSLALEPVDQGETPVSGYEGTEPFVAKPTRESPASAEQLMEEVCKRENLVRAWKRVRSNQGGPGVDGLTIDDAKDHLREHWPSIRSQLLEGTYQPQPVKRVEIPKPDGGIRKLGVPCVVDRLIQQALLQVLQKRWDPTFSEHSYGFRPGRSAHQAVAQAQRYSAEGYSVVVDLDLEKFFDRVNHDGLMARVAARVSDKRALKLIQAFLKSGVMEDGLVSPVDEGTPQGGPLSPLLSNLVLDDLDKKLTRRGLRFCRYADDANIYVRSRRAGERVMAFRRDREFDVSALQGRLSTSSQSQCSTAPGLIAGTSHRPLFLTRDRWFESGFLQQRVRCESDPWRQSSTGGIESCDSSIRSKFIKSRPPSAPVPSSL